MLYSINIVQIVYLSFELEIKKNENKQKEAEIGSFFKKRMNDNPVPKVGWNNIVLWYPAKIISSLIGNWILK